MVRDVCGNNVRGCAEASRGRETLQGQLQARREAFPCGLKCGNYHKSTAITTERRYYDEYFLLILSFQTAVTPCSASLNQSKQPKYADFTDRTSHVASFAVTPQVCFQRSLDSEPVS